MKITAKVQCSARESCGDDQSTVRFTANYTDRAGYRINDEWAKYTPSFALTMTVLDSVPFEPGQDYTLTFEPDGQ